MGDHFTARDEAQNLANHIGKIVRITAGRLGAAGQSVRRPQRAPSRKSGATATATPRASRSTPPPASCGSTSTGRAAATRSTSVEKGKNYGWPVIGYGINYDGAKIHDSTRKAGMEQPIKYWVPSIAPSGMAFYTGDLFPAWKGNLFVGALAGQLLVRLELDGEKVVKEERLLHGPARAHPRRAPGTRRRALAADRQFGPHPARAPAK